MWLDSTIVLEFVAISEMAAASPYTRLKHFEYAFGTVAYRDGTTVVSNTKLNRLDLYSADGSTIRIGRSGAGMGCFSSPRGVCAVGQDTVAVADSGNARVQLITLDGDFIRTVSGGELRKPWDVACTPQGRLVVVDFEQSVLKLFTVEGKVLQTLGEGVFEAPSRVEVHSLTGNVHVADRRGTRLHVLSCSAASCALLETKELDDAATPH